MNDQRIAKTIWKPETDARRRRGRPTRKWNMKIKDSLKKIDTNELDQGGTGGEK